VALGANPKKIRVLPNGVDRSVFFPRNKEEARQKLGWPLNASIILSVGRLVELKGFNLLIKAINRVRSGINKSIQCFIVGDGEERPLLEKQIKQNHLENEIKLAGWVSPQDLPFWYSAADLFCLLSHSEGCPNVVLESLACGTPVVATRAGGTYEVVQEEVTGLMIENRSEEEVARQIEKALEMHWNRNIIQMSETVRDWSEVARAQVQLFQQLTDQA
jgi:glycosyltransferase involved in cell wall biosynthesis